MRVVKACFNVIILLSLPGRVMAAEKIVIGASALVETDPRQEYARYVRFRPADGQKVTLNPPRFSWPYLPEIVPSERRFPAGRTYTLQMSRTSRFSRPDVEVSKTPCNFYNFLPELKGAKKWFWRVGYEVGTLREKWSKVRSFTIAEDAVVWDRSAFADLSKLIRGHPRMLFNSTNLDQMHNLRKTNALSRELADHIIATADKTLKKPWYRNFPEDDKRPGSFMQYGRSLIFVAFAYILTDDEKYAGFKERFLRMASWPKGGFSSPEGIVREKWSTHITEYLGLFYDWFYHQLTKKERELVRNSLEWRIEYTMNNFAWTRKGGKEIRVGSIAVHCGSHPYENLMVTIPGALAIYEESEVARFALELGLNYLIGITCGMGEDEAWNEGPGYGNGKMKWLMDATFYLNTAIPELHLEKNEAYSAYGDFFARITPIGAEHSSFGNRGINERDWCSSRITNFRRLALLRNNGRFLQNWNDTRKRLADLGRKNAQPASPWVDYSLPLYYPTPPLPRKEDDPIKLFPLEGWVTVSSAPPSDYQAQDAAVSMTFHCRPRGGYSHSFRSENAFDIYAYGKTITVGGGTTSNQSYFANHTMRHNTILVNGREQSASAAGKRAVYGRIVAFQRGPNFVYWAGDATAAYGSEAKLEHFIRHILFVRNAYFVIYDDLAVEAVAKPTHFQWLYHIYPAVPYEFSEADFSIRYTIGATEVLLQHLAHIGDLTLENRRGTKGMINPITGENLTEMTKWNKDGRKKTPKPLDAHHFWISHRTPQRQMQFLAVIIPYRNGEKPPEVERLGDRALRINFRGQKDIISFGPRKDANIVVDVEVIRPGCTGKARPDL